MARVVRRGGALLPALVLLAMASCSLTTELDGLTGGASDAGSVPTETGTGADVAAPSFDSGSEAGTDTGSPAPPDAGSCPNKPIALCEEFLTDEKANAWQIVQGAGGTTQILTDDAGARGLYASVPMQGSGDAPFAYWQRPFDKTVSKVSFDADFGYDAHPVNTGEYHIMLALRLDHGATWNLIYLSTPTVSNGWVIQDFPQHAGDDIDYRVVDITTNVKHHLHFDVTAGGMANLVVDAAVLQSNPAPSFVLAGQPTLMLGVTVSGVPTTALNVGFQHVVFTGE